MRRYATPPVHTVASTARLTDDVVRHATTDPDRALLARREDDAWVDVTAAEFQAQVRDVASGLLAAGVGHGDRVGLLSRTRYEWTLVDYAIWWVGAVTVPVYETSSDAQLQWALSDSGAVACVVETRDQATRVSRLRSDLPDLDHVWALDTGAVQVLTTLGTGVSATDLEVRRTAVGADDLATIVYTSGTTGRPKGCELTHGNLDFELGAATSVLHDLFDADDASTLLFLPLAHVFARIIQIGAIRSGVRLGHTSDIADLTAALAGFRPTFLLAVPRVFEKVFNRASQRAYADGRGRVFDRAAEVAIAYSRALEGRVPLRLRAQHTVFDRLVYARLREALGGRVTYAISGGAPLGERLSHFYRGIGLPVLEGYGLTETSAAVTVNLPDLLKVGTVGRPLAGTEVKVGDDGELLFRGGQVFRGYWGRPDETAEVLEPDGWFHTGDLGEIDSEGFVRVTGRKKEILVTAGGKNVAPAVLEDRIRAHPLVGQCMVVGDGKPFIGALLTLDPETAPEWAAQHGRSRDLAELVDDPDVLAELQTAVDDANSAVSRAESIRAIRVLDSDWTEESGHLTPTLKLKRAVVLRDFHAEVESLFP